MKFSFGITKDTSWSQCSDKLQRILAIKWRVLSQMGENIRRERRRVGFSQEQLGWRLNVSNATVAAWEHGKRFPKTDKLYIMCCLFNRSADYMLGFTRDKRELELDLK